MQNLNEEDFKKKYLKYKAKYLELKDLLKGGLTREVTEKDACSKREKGKCGTDLYCVDAMWKGCNFVKKAFDESEKRLNECRALQSHGCTSANFDVNRLTNTEKQICCKSMDGACTIKEDKCIKVPSGKKSFSGRI
jgi:hypothetical protein